MVEMRRPRLEPPSTALRASGEEAGPAGAAAVAAAAAATAAAAAVDDHGAPRLTQEAAVAVAEALLRARAATASAAAAASVGPCTANAAALRSTRSKRADEMLLAVAEALRAAVSWAELPSEPDKLCRLQRRSNSQRISQNLVGWVTAKHRSSISLYGRGGDSSAKGTP